MDKLNTVSLVLISMTAIISLSASCSSANKSGTTIRFTRPPTPVLTTSVVVGKIGGLSTGGEPTVITHPIAGFENCISCHGVTGSALHLVYDSVHPCEQCHAMFPEPDWGIHDNSSTTDTPRLNASCTICHKPS